MRDQPLSPRAIARMIREGTRELESEVLGLVEWAPIQGLTPGDGGTMVGTTDDGEEIQIVEPYGLASRPPGSATAVALAPGAELQGRVGIGVSSPNFRPPTDAGDAVLWTSEGHRITLDDDGPLTVAGKDGSTIVLEDSGAITITAGPASSITINVDAGQSVNVGGAGAASLLKAQDAQSHIVAAASYATLPGNFAPNDGGVLAFTNFAAFLNGTAVIPPAIPGNDLVNAAATEKAKGE